MFTESGEFYDAIYSSKDYANEAAIVAGLVRSRVPNARTILDVACGTGEHARWLTDEHAFEVDGLDLDSTLLKIARTKCPMGRFVEGDMRDFNLGRSYDGVVCLFSSIAYLVTLDRVTQALRVFHDHLATNGIVVVEPWFAPGVLDPHRVTVDTAESGGQRIERLAKIDVDERVSHLRFEYRVDGPDGVRETSEVHALGLFTIDEMRGAFEAAGLAPKLDPVGLTGRGLWIARPAPQRL